jgi:hypothetical protein
MFQFPGFAFYPYVFRIKYLLSDNQKSETGSPDRNPRPPASKFQLSKVGCPIRKSAGQRPFAPHHSLSQRTTSFIASYRQGIHQMPLGRLIALISNAHLMLSFPHTSSAFGTPSLGWQTLLKKDQKSFEINPDTSRGRSSKPPLAIRSAGSFRNLRPNAFGR